MAFTLNVNGASHTVDVDADTPLLWVLRDNLQLTGTKFGCGIAQCGACTVHINGQPVRSCSSPVSAVGEQPVNTIDSLTDHPVQRAWIAHDVPQCGYCQSGMIMASVALLEANKDPSDAEIDSAITNICRCGTYNRVRMAIHEAAGELRGSNA
jgi:isoquinoline 1-oxidoreductase alpha subunit